MNGKRKNWYIEHDQIENTGFSKGTVKKLRRQATAWEKYLQNTRVIKNFVTVINFFFFFFSGLNPSLPALWWWKWAVEIFHLRHLVWCNASRGGWKDSEKGRNFLFLFPRVLQGAGSLALGSYRVQLSPLPGSCRDQLPQLPLLVAQGNQQSPAARSFPQNFLKVMCHWQGTWLWTTSLSIPQLTLQQLPRYGTSLWTTSPILPKVPFLVSSGKPSRCHPHHPLNHTVLFPTRSGASPWTFHLSPASSSCPCICYSCIHQSSLTFTSQFSITPISC